MSMMSDNNIEQGTSTHTFRWHCHDDCTLLFVLSMFGAILNLIKMNTRYTGLVQLNINY